MSTNNEQEYFVMLTTQPGGMSPLVDEDGQLATFSSVEAANAAGEGSQLGDWFGFEVFKRGHGE